MNTESEELNFTQELFNFSSEFNLTDIPKDESKTLGTIHDVIVMIIAGSAMFAMGCDITLLKVREHLRLPKPVVMGLFGQYILMPFLGYCVVLLLGLPGHNAAGVIILCCSPGGGYSNLISFLTFGDVPLSVLMTTLSSVLSLGLTPLNLWIYGNGLMHMDITMPFTNIIISLVLLQVILMVGVAIKWRFAKIASFITKAGVALSVTLLLLRQIITIVLHPNYYSMISWKLYAAVGIIPTLGFLIPYLLALITKQPSPIRRTIAWETSIQSIGTAFTIALVSFPPNVVFEVQKYIAIYSDVSVTGFISLAVIFRAVHWLCEKQRTAGHVKVKLEELYLDSDAERL